MTAFAWILAATLVAVPAADNKDKKKPVPAAAATPAPNPGEAALAQGRELEAKAELDTAIDAYQAAAATLTGAAKGEALARLSILQHVRGMAASTASAEAAAAADAEGGWPSSALAMARAREGKAEEALALARKAIAAGGDAPAQAALGAAQAAAGDMTAAEEAYRAAGGTDASKVSAAIGLARVLRLTRRPAEAEPILQKVIAAFPGAVPAYKESARVKIALGRGKEAMGDGATAAALAENDPEVAALAVEAAVAGALDFVAAKQADFAVQDLTRLRDSHPDAAVVRVGLAKALLAQRKGDAAIVELQKAVELAPDSAEALHHLGVTQHMYKQNAAAAVPSLEKAASAEPGNAAYRISLGAALVDAKQYDRAVAELTPVVRTAPDRPDGWIYLGAAHLQAKRYKDAIAALDKAAALAPRTAQVEAYLAWSYFGLKDAAGFKLHGGKARSLGHKEATLLQYLTRIEGGEAIK